MYPCYGLECWQETLYRAYVYKMQNLAYLLDKETR